MAKTSANGKRIGRPSTYRPEKVAPILDRIAAGETLSKICAEPGQPNIWTVYEWLRVEEGFATAYARAQDSRADTLADQIADLADEAMRETQAAALRRARADGADRRGRWAAQGAARLRR